GPSPTTSAPATPTGSSSQPSPSSSDPRDGHAMGGRRRRLTDEEATLWQGVARTVAPLAQRVKTRRVAKQAAAPGSPPPAPAAPPAPPEALHKPRVRPPPPSPAPLDRRTLSRLVRGHVGIDARLDLHGLTQAAAHERLIGFLVRVQADGGRTVL